MAFKRLDLNLGRLTSRGDEHVRAMQSAAHSGPNAGPALEIELAQTYGRLDEVMFIEGPPHPRAVLVYEDGTGVAVGRGTYIGILTFGYHGEGPSVFSGFLKAAGFSLHDVTDVQPPLRLLRNGDRVEGVTRSRRIRWSDGTTVYVPQRPPPAEQTERHSILLCVNCSKQLRAPTDKGLLTITCPNCQTRFGWVPPLDSLGPLPPVLRWERRGSSAEQIATFRARRLASDQVRVTVVFDPVELATQLLPGNFLVRGYGPDALAAGKIQGGEVDPKRLQQSLDNGLALLRSECVVYPTFPLVYSRFFVPTAPIFEAGTFGLEGILLEHVGNSTDADFQDWATSLEMRGRTSLHIYDDANNVVASAEVEKEADIAALVARAIDEADQVLQEIESHLQSFKQASAAFFAEHTEPSWMPVTESKDRDPDHEQALLHEIRAAFLGDERILQRWIARSFERFPSGSVVERYQWILEVYRRDNA